MIKKLISFVIATAMAGATLTAFAENADIITENTPIAEEAVETVVEIPDGVIEETEEGTVVEASDEISETIIAETMEIAETCEEKFELLSASGTCGDNLTWTLEDGTLTISGTGDMYNYLKSSQETQL